MEAMLKFYITKMRNKIMITLKNKNVKLTFFFLVGLFHFIFVDSPSIWETKPEAVIHYPWASFS